MLLLGGLTDITAPFQRFKNLMVLFPTHEHKNKNPLPMCSSINLCRNSKFHRVGSIRSSWEGSVRREWGRLHASLAVRIAAVALQQPQPWRPPKAGVRSHGFSPSDPDVLVLGLENRKERRGSWSSCEKGHYPFSTPWLTIGVCNSLGS